MDQNIVETNEQFLARMLVATREGHQISSRDAQHLSDLSQFGPGAQPVTMPEERRSANKPLTKVGAKDTVQG